MNKSPINFTKLDEDEYMKFYTSLKNAKEQNRFGCFVSLESPEFYAGTTNFLLGERIAGFSLLDGDLIAVHKNPTLAQQYGVKHVMDDIMLVAIENGAKTLDCYGEALANIYMSYGFLPTGKMKFDPQYNPEWDTSKFGAPDVIAFFRGVSNFDELNFLKSQDKFARYCDIEAILPIYDDYEKMLRDRDKIFEYIAKHKLDYFKALEYVQSLSKKRS